MATRTARKTNVPGGADGGVITSISAQKKSTSRVNIHVDGEYAFSVHLDILVSEGLYKGQQLSSDEVENICLQDDFHLARDLALHFVSYRPRSIHEVRQRLLKAKYNNGVIDRVISRLIELNMLDDESFAIEYVEGRLRNKGYGPRRLRQDLKQKGIQESLIQKTLTEAFEKTDPEALALTAGTKIFPRLLRIDDARIRRKKLSDYLARRGFTFDHMNRALEELELHVQKLEE